METLTYSKTFSTETQEDRNIRIKASSIRTRLTSRGCTQTFRLVLSKISDAELVAKEAAHHRETLEFRNAQRVAALPKVKIESAVSSHTKAAMLAAGFSVGE